MKRKRREREKQGQTYERKRSEREKEKEMPLSKKRKKRIKGRGRGQSGQRELCPANDGYQMNTTLLSRGKDFYPHLSPSAGLSLHRPPSAHPPLPRRIHLTHPSPPETHPSEEGVSEASAPTTTHLSQGKRRLSVRAD